MEKNKEPVITESTTFDERRKVLIHKVKEESENELGSMVSSSEAVIHGDGIKKTLMNLKKRKEGFETNIAQLKERLGEKPILTKELEELKENLKTLQLIAMIEKQSPEDRKKEEDQLIAFEKDLKSVKKSLKEITDAVGTRLKL